MAAETFSDFEEDIWSLLSFLYGSSVKNIYRSTSLRFGRLVFAGVFSLATIVGSTAYTPDTRAAAVDNAIVVDEPREGVFIPAIAAAAWAVEVAIAGAIAAGVVAAVVLGGPAAGRPRNAALEDFEGTQILLD